jgi:hypothetical protein
MTLLLVVGVHEAVSPSADLRGEAPHMVYGWREFSYDATGLAHQIEWHGG